MSSDRYKQGEQTRLIKHFHYIKWPDMKVPDKLSMLEFVRLVRSYVDDKKGCPVIVHCRYTDQLSGLSDTTRRSRFDDPKK